MGRSTHSDRTTAWAGKNKTPGYTTRKIVPSAESLNKSANNSSTTKKQQINTIIYTSTHCPYCHTVERFITENSIDVVYRNILDSDIKNELIKLAGRGQVPYMHDEKTGIKMPESQDIINYLTENYVS